MRDGPIAAPLSKIVLHPGLKEATQEEFITIFLHEAAHIAAYLFDAYNQGHGIYWAKWMFLFHLDPIRHERHLIPSCMKRVPRETATLEDFDPSTFSL